MASFRPELIHDVYMCGHVNLRDMTEDEIGLFVPSGSSNPFRGMNVVRHNTACSLRHCQKARPVPRLDRDDWKVAEIERVQEAIARLDVEAFLLRKRMLAVNHNTLARILALDSAKQYYEWQWEDSEIGDTDADDGSESSDDSTFASGSMGIHETTPFCEARYHLRNTCDQMQLYLSATLFYFKMDEILEILEIAIRSNTDMTAFVEKVEAADRAGVFADSIDPGPNDAAIWAIPKFPDRGHFDSSEDGSESGYTADSERSSETTPHSETSVSGESGGSDEKALLFGPNGDIVSPEHDDLYEPSEDYQSIYGPTDVDVTPSPTASIVVTGDVDDHSYAPYPEDGNFKAQARVRTEIWTHGVRNQVSPGKDDTSIHIRQMHEAFDASFACEYHTKDDEWIAFLNGYMAATNAWRYAIRELTEELMDLAVDEYRRELGRCCCKHCTATNPMVADDDSSESSDQGELRRGHYIEDDRNLSSASDEDDEIDYLLKSLDLIGMPQPPPPLHDLRSMPVDMNIPPYEGDESAILGLARQSLVPLRWYRRSWSVSEGGGMRSPVATDGSSTSSRKRSRTSESEDEGSDAESASKRHRSGSKSSSSSWVSVDADDDLEEFGGAWV